MKQKVIMIFIALLGLSMIGADGCDGQSTPEPRSDSGAIKASVKVKKDVDGLTVEQRNVADRLMMDNEPGSIKHLYIISAMSGDVLIYSTVRGKVTSSDKRLTPINIMSGDSPSFYGFPVDVGGVQRYTNEVLQDDGTYGSSISYLYWWDSRGIYHQHYPSGGQIIHISNQPMNFPKIILNLEEENEKEASPVKE